MVSVIGEVVRTQLMLDVNVKFAWKPYKRKVISNGETTMIKQDVMVRAEAKHIVWTVGTVLSS